MKLWSNMTASILLIRLSKKLNDHVERTHWLLINKKDVPDSVKITPSMWSMKRKRDITTRKAIKYKSRLNVHGVKQEHG